MESIVITPDKKLITKGTLTLLTLSFLFGLIGLILQITIPLGGYVTPGEAAIILWPITAGVIVLIWIISYPIIVLWTKNLSYHIEEDKVIIHKGILSKIQQNIPYKAVTDFVLQRSLYDRFLGIAAIRIQTAGQSAQPTGYEANMAGLIDWQANFDELKSRLKDVRRTDNKIPEVTASSEDVGLKEIYTELQSIRKILESKN